MKRSRLRAQPKPKDYDLVLAAEWHAAIVHRKAVCAVCGGRRRLQGHHVLPKAIIEDFVRSERHDNEQRNRLLWDRRNGVALCTAPCHERITNAFSRLPRASIPASVWLFAEALGAMASTRPPTWATARLERLYPE